MKFRADADGFITGAALLQAPATPGRTSGTCGRDGGTLLADGHVHRRDAVGWQQARSRRAGRGDQGHDLRRLVPTRADGTYYADTDYFFLDGRRRRAAARAGQRPNGVYTYGGGFPTDSFDATNYCADVVFTPTDHDAAARHRGLAGRRRDRRRPGRRGRRRPSTRRSTRATVDGGTFQLRDGAGALVPADVTYDAATRTATLRPRRRWRWAITYTAVVKGGAVGVARHRRQRARAGPHLVVHHGGAAARLQRPAARSAPRARSPARAPAGSAASTGRRRAPRKRLVRHAEHASGCRGTGRSSCASRVPRARAAAACSCKLAGRQAHRRDQDGDRGRRQDQDGHAQAEPRRPAATCSASGRCTPPRVAIAPTAPTARAAHPAALTQDATDGDTDATTSHDTDRHLEHSSLQTHRGRPRARRAARSAPPARARSPAADAGPGRAGARGHRPGDPFGTYYAEILRAEGLNEFAVADTAQPRRRRRWPATRSWCWPQTALTDAQVALLTDWVQGGGNLIAMRPDAQLAACSASAPTPAHARQRLLKVDTASAAGRRHHRRRRCSSTAPPTAARSAARRDASRRSTPTRPPRPRTRP